MAGIVPAEDAQGIEPLHAFVFGAGDGQDGVERAGHAQRAAGDARGLDLLIAPEALCAGKAIVAGGDADADTRCGGGVIDLGHALVVIRAAGKAEGEVRTVDAEGDGVFNGSDEIIEIAVAALVKDLHDDKLCLRRDAEGRHIELLLIRFGQVARNDTGNVCAVAHHSVVIGAEVGLAVGIVEAKRDLAAVINGVKRRGLIQLFGMQGLAVEDGCDVFLAVGNGVRIGGFLGERRVLEAQAGVDDGDAHAGAVIARVPCGVRAHTGGRELHVRADLRGVRLHGIDLRHGVARGKEDLLDARQLAERFHIAIGNRGGNSVRHEGELTSDLDAVAKLLLRDGKDGGLAVLHALHGGQLCLAEALAQLNGHAVHLTDGRGLKRDDNLDLVVLLVGLAHNSDLVAVAVILAAQDRLHGIGIGRRFLRVIFAADQCLTVVCRDGAFRAIGQRGQRLGLRCAEGAAGNIGILRCLARVDPSVGGLVYIGIARRDVGGLAVCGIDDLAGRLLRLRSALHCTGRGHTEKAERHCQAKDKRHQLFRQRFHIFPPCNFYSLAGFSAQRE